MLTAPMPDWSYTVRITVNASNPPASFRQLIAEKFAEEGLILCDLSKVLQVGFINDTDQPFYVGSDMDVGALAFSTSTPGWHFLYGKNVIDFMISSADGDFGLTLLISGND